jgi:hypothetical protein
LDGRYSKMSGKKMTYERAPHWVDPFVYKTPIYV